MENILVIYAGKGKDGLLNDIWVFDFQKSVWHSVGYSKTQYVNPSNPYLGTKKVPFPPARAGHQVIFKGGVLYMTGGWYGSRKQCERVIVCSAPNMDTWKIKITSDFQPQVFICHAWLQLYLFIFEAKNFV
jgi:hypothetical protein